MNSIADRNESHSPYVEWATKVAEAKLLALAGAWPDVHRMLSPIMDDSCWDASTSQIDACILLMFACGRLQHRDHLEKGNLRLLHVLATGRDLPSETAVGANIVLARQEAERGDYSDALRRIESSYVAECSAWLRAHALILRSRIDSRLGRIEAARSSIVRAIECAEVSGSEGLRADALMRLGHLFRVEEGPDSAQRIYAMAATSYWRCGDLLGRSSALTSRALALLVLGRFSESAETYQDALRVAEGVGRHLTAIRARLGLAWLDVRNGNLQQARRSLLSAWREARREGAAREEVLALEYLAEANALLRRGGQAVIALRYCKERASRMSLEGDLGVEIEMRWALLALNDDAQCASRYACRAAARAKKIGLCWEQAQSLRLLGTARVLSGQKKSRARSAFLASKSLLSRIGERFESAIVDAWLEALARPAGWIPKELQASEQGIPDEPEARAFRFWLEHPLLGPYPWLRKRAGMIGRTVVLRGQRGPQSPCSDVVGEHGIDQSQHTPLHSVWSELGILTRSSRVVTLLSQAETYAGGRMPVLLLGETGTGKDLLARGLHLLSGRSGAYVPVNCAAAQHELFVAELFGACRGAYTGAFENRRGLVHEAEAGTLFLDEVADLNLPAQGYLLRFLDSGEVRPVGASKGSYIETRVVAATCRDLRGLVALGRFRRDLYMRLAAAILHIPPLRNRQEDLELLVPSLWQRNGGAQGEYAQVFTPEVLREMRDRQWPGNVRGLAHAVAQALLFARAGQMNVVSEMIKHQAGPMLRRRTRLKTEVRSAEPALWVLALPPLERRGPAALQRALSEAQGSISKAARILGVSRCHAYRLYNRIGRR